MAGSGISVLIPTYQRREAVLGAIASVLGQTHPPAEILVIDDGSTDGTAEAVEARFGAHVRLLRQPNRGPSAARNLAAASARGDVLTFLDSDNRWLPHHLEVLGEIAARRPQAAIVCTERSYMRGLDTADSVQSFDLARPLLLGQAGIGHVSAMGVRRDAFLQVGGFDVGLRHSEDIDLYIRLAIEGPVAMIAATTTEVNVSPDSLRAEGCRTGGHLAAIGRSAENAMALLNRCRRPDVGELRTYCAARYAIGEALAAVARCDPPMVVRRPLFRACSLALDSALSLQLVLSHAWVVPGWERPERRAEIELVLRQAWPDPRQ